MKKTAYRITGTLLAILMLGSCTNGFEEMNQNPNEPTEIPASFLLAGAQRQLMNDMSDEWNNGRFGMQWAQYWASNQYADESRYRIRVASNNNLWAGFYAGWTPRPGVHAQGGGLNDLEEIIRIAEREDLIGVSENQIAVALILQSWVYHVLTDIYGAIPYEEALQGQANASPALTLQPDVYTGLIETLDQAYDMIDPSYPGFNTGDIIYGGDMVKWQKFAMSLKARVAIRMADADDATARAAFNDAIDKGVFASADEEALFPYTANYPNNNPLNEDYKTRNDFAISNTFIDKLVELDDPRLAEYAEPSVQNDVYLGMPYGLQDDQAALIPADSVSQRDPQVLEATFPGILLTYTEVEFMMAEAAQRGWITDGAEDHYNAAVRASMEWWGIESAEIDDYLIDNPYDAADWKVSLGIQKWIALYMQGLQGWIEYRRLDFGVLQEPESGAILGDGSVPVRLTYPTDVQVLNEENYKEAIAAQGADQLDTKLWWDKF